MESPVVLHFERDTNISFTFIGLQEDIASFLGHNTRDNDNSPLVFEAPDGKLPPPSDQFRIDLAAGRAYFADPVTNQPPNNLNLGNQPLPDRLKPMLPLLPEELQKSLYYVKPAEETPSVLTFVSTQDLEHWLAAQPIKRYRYPSQAVRDMLVQRPELLLNLGTDSPSVPPYPRVRAYPTSSTAFRSLRVFASTATHSTLAICVQALKLNGQLCVRMPDACSVSGHHTWILSGGDSVRLSVTIKTGTADLECAGTVVSNVSAPGSQDFELPGTENRLDIARVGDSMCKYQLTDACLAGGILV